MFCFLGFFMVLLPLPWAKPRVYCCVGTTLGFLIQCLYFVFLAIKGMLDFVLQKQTTFYFSLPWKILGCCGSCVTHASREYWSFKVHCKFICNLSDEVTHDHITGVGVLQEPPRKAGQRYFCSFMFMGTLMSYSIPESHSGPWFSTFYILSLGNSIR